MATSAQTIAPGGAKPPFPPFNQDTFASQLVWLAIFFVALYVLMSKVAIPRIGGIVEARRERIEGDIAEAARLKDQSDAALKGYEQSLADARAQAQARRTKRATGSMPRPRGAARRSKRSSTPSSPKPRRPSPQPKPGRCPMSAASQPRPQARSCSA
jgi:hypothetical protein